MKYAPILLLLVGCAVGQSKLDVHGLYVGMPTGLANQVVTLHGGEIHDNTLNSDSHTAHFKDGFSVEYGIRDGKVEYLSLDFYYRSYGEHLARAIAKWGPPTRQGTGTLANYYGAKFSYRSARWETKTVAATLSERSESNVDVGNLFVTSRSQKNLPAPPTW